MIYAKDFHGTTDDERIQSAILAANQSKTSKTVQLEDKDYYIESKIHVMEDVELLFGYGSRFVAVKDTPLMEVQRNASVTNPYIAIDTVDFDSPIFLLDGKHKYYNSWNRTAIKDGVIVNWSGSNKGTGFKFYAGGKDHEISFVNVSNMKIAGLKRGIDLEVEKPEEGMAWVNANRFSGITIEDCIEMITMNGTETIPAECSGNIFTGLQLQPSIMTEKVLKVCGQHNRFDGMIWDVHMIPTENYVDITEQSAHTKLDISALPERAVRDLGKYTAMV